jgi:hypothetical protein
VLHRVANPDTMGKLQLKWDGPFLVVSSSRPGSYRLKDMDGNDIPLGMRMSFEDIMCKLFNFLIFFLWHLFPFKRGERFLMGP